MCLLVTYSNLCCLVFLLYFFSNLFKENWRTIITSQLPIYFSNLCFTTPKGDFYFIPSCTDQYPHLTTVCIDFCATLFHLCNFVFYTYINYEQTFILAMCLYFSQLHNCKIYKKNFIYKITSELSLLLIYEEIGLAYSFISFKCILNIYKRTNMCTNICREWNFFYAI